MITNKVLNKEEFLKQFNCDCGLGKVNYYRLYLSSRKTNTKLNISISCGRRLEITSGYVFVREAWHHRDFYPESIRKLKETSFLTKEIIETIASNTQI